MQTPTSNLYTADYVSTLPPQRNVLLRIGSTLLKSPVGTAGTIIVGFVILIAIIGPLISPHDPVNRNLRARFKPPGYSDDSGAFALGTDQLGRDILSRIIAGSRVSVLVGIVSVMISGYYRRGIRSSERLFRWLA